MISLEEFLEVEVRPCINCIITITPDPFNFHSWMSVMMTTYIRSDTNSVQT